MHLFFQPRVSDHQTAIVENIVAHESIKECSKVFAKRLSTLTRQSLDFAERVRQAVTNLDFLALQVLQQFHVVIAGNAERGPSRDHIWTNRTASRILGPRSTRSPKKIAFLPSGCE